jgi:hypothetical protein
MITVDFLLHQHQKNQVVHQYIGFGYFSNNFFLAAKTGTVFDSKLITLSAFRLFTLAIDHSSTHDKGCPSRI